MHIPFRLLDLGIPNSQRTNCLGCLGFIANTACIISLSLYRIICRLLIHNLHARTLVQSIVNVSLTLFDCLLILYVFSGLPDNMSSSTEHIRGLEFHELGRSNPIIYNSIIHKPLSIKTIHKPVGVYTHLFQIKISSRYSRDVLYTS